MKTLLLLTLVVLFATTTSATDYYFSTSSGDDSRTSAQAQNPSTPWKTLSKLNSIFSSLQPGDAVLLKRGETFYGSITITKSGTASSPIFIGAYGTGDKPVITSLVKLNNWVSKGNGIWESYNSTLGSTVNIVLLNGIQQGMGRYPNYDADNGGYLHLESHVGKTSITDNELTSAINWTGAELVLRTRRWILDRSTITSHSGSTITGSPLASTEPKNGNGYFFQNSVKTLDKLGEWYYNPSTQKLNVYFGSNSPYSYSVEATTKEFLVVSGGYSNVVFNNLTIKGANSVGVDITNGSNMVVENCDVQFSGVNGVEVNGQANFKIENSTVANSNNDGIHFDWGMTSAIVRNNKILNTYIIAGAGLGGDGKGVGIYDNGDGNIVEYNEIHNTGHNGIRFRGNNLIISNNLIDSFCLTKDDGSGIYSYGSYGNMGIKVIGNIIKDGIGAEDGTGISTFSTAGIYIDHNDSKIEVRDNTVFDCHDYGMYIHNSSGITTKNNTFYNNGRRQLAMVQGQPDVATLVRNNITTQNIFFSKLQTQTTSQIESSANDLSNFGKFDSNYYARPIDDRITINNIYPGVNKTLDLESWKSQYGDDPASKRTAKQIAAFKINSLIGTNRIVNGTFTNATTGTSSSSASISLGTSGLLDGGYLVVSPSAPKSTISFKVGTITAGKKYVLKYSLVGAANTDLILTSYLRFDASPYTVIAERQSRKVSTTRSENEMIFLAMASTSGSITFQADIQSKYYLDNIQFYEADAKITNPDDSIRFFYNATKVNKTFSLDGNYIDTKGSKFSNTITLSPYSSSVLIKNGGATTPNTAPTVDITSPVVNAKFEAPATITINAAAADEDGSISKVDFYNGSILLGSDNTSPYSYTWSSVAAGNYSITAKATDNGSLATTSDAINISVSAPNQAPTVSVTGPVANAKFVAPASITISVAASDADGSITKVDFYNGNTLLGSDNTSPYSFTWNNVAAGSYSLTAKATDNGSLAATSSTVGISVTNPNSAPTVNITSPVSGAKFEAPASITVSATATDIDGSVTKVDFYNGNTFLGSDNTSPYSFTLNNVAAGSYSLTAKATDNGSLAATSSAVGISVTNPNSAPTVNITSPASGAKFEAPASITISVTAADMDGSVTKVDFYNGNTLLGSDNTSPYSFTLNNVAAGSYSLTAKATDNGSLITTSDAVSVSVNNQNSAPSVSITSPITNAKFDAPASITISATAADVDGSITKVDFYNGTILLGSDNTSPYTFTWNNVAAGSYSLTAKATDNDLLVISSSAVTVLVSDPNKAPVVNIISPITNTSFGAPASIAISAAASDADGSIMKVDFYNGNTLLGSDDTSPYSFIWNNVAAGSYSLTAKATDNGSLVSTSPAVSVFVSNSNAAPTIKIITPETNTIYNGPATVKIIAEANDPDGYITKVEFLKGTNHLYNDYAPPYNCTLTGLKVGNYKISAKVTDNNGVTTQSDFVLISVVEPAKAVDADSLNTTLDSVSIPEIMAKTSLTANAKVTNDQKDLTGNSLETLSIKVWPNPTSSMLSISKNGMHTNMEMKISVLSITGKVFKTIQTNSSNQVVQLNVSSLPAGVYLIQAMFGETIVYKQFVKQ